VEQRDPAVVERHIEKSQERLPGPPYYQVLRWIHEALRPTNYVEIGIYTGWSLRMALPDTRCIGIDPEPRLSERIPGTTVYELTSEEFFARHDLVEILGARVALGFIDGLHRFEQVLRDFINLERLAQRAGVLLLHDSIPLDGPTSARERLTDFHSGDVWKAALALADRRPDLEMATIRTAPTGLTMVRGLDAANESLERDLSEIVACYLELDYNDYLASRERMPPELANEEDAVAGWLAAHPAR